MTMNNPQFLIAIRRVGLHCQETALASPAIFCDLLARDLLLRVDDAGDDFGKIAATIVELYIQSLSPELTLDEQTAVKEHIDEFLREFRRLEKESSSAAVGAPIRKRSRWDYEPPGGNVANAAAVAGISSSTLRQDSSSENNRQLTESIRRVSSAPPPSPSKRPRHDETAPKDSNNNNATTTSDSREQEWSNNETIHRRPSHNNDDTNNKAAAPWAAPWAAPTPPAQAPPPPPPPAIGSAVTLEDIKHIRDGRKIPRHHLKYLSWTTHPTIWCDLCRISVGSVNTLAHVLGKKHTAHHEQEQEQSQYETRQTQQQRFQQQQHQPEAADPSHMNMPLQQQPSPLTVHRHGYSTDYARFNDPNHNATTTSGSREQEWSNNETIHRRPSHNNDDTTNHAGASWTAPTPSAQAPPPPPPAIGPALTLEDIMHIHGGKKIPQHHVKYLSWGTTCYPSIWCDLCRISINPVKVTLAHVLSNKHSVRYELERQRLTLQQYETRQTQQQRFQHQQHQPAAADPNHVNIPLQQQPPPPLTVHRRGYSMDNARSNDPRDGAKNGPSPVTQGLHQQPTEIGANATTMIPATASAAAADSVTARSNHSVAPKSTITVTTSYSNPPLLPPPSYGVENHAATLPEMTPVSPEEPPIIPVIARPPPPARGASSSLFGGQSEDDVQIPDLQTLERQDEVVTAILLLNDPQPNGARNSQFARTLQPRPSTTVRFQKRYTDESVRRILTLRWAKWEPYWELLKIVKDGVTSPIRSSQPNVAASNTIHSAAEVTFRITKRSVGSDYYRPLEQILGKVKSDQRQQQPADGDLELIVCTMALSPDPARAEGSHVWPKGTFLQFNGSVMKLKQRYHEAVSKKWTGNYGEFLRLTPSIRQSMVDQKVSLACADTGDFVVAVLLCRYRGNARLYESIRSDLPRLSLPDGLAKAVASLAVRADEEVSADELHVRLTCPLTKRLLQVPVRGKSCRHFQCFDLQSFIENNTVVAHNRWRCFVCERRLSIYDLELCCLTQSLLSAATTERNLVKIDRTGSYHLAGETTANTKRLPEPADVVEIL